MEFPTDVSEPDTNASDLQIRAKRKIAEKIALRVLSLPFFFVNVRLDFFICLVIHSRFLVLCFFLRSYTPNILEMRSGEANLFFQQIC